MALLSNWKDDDSIFFALQKKIPVLLWLERNYPRQERFRGRRICTRITTLGLQTLFLGGGVELDVGQIPYLLT